MFPKSFVAWMDEHKELREMIANGKDKLEWSRQVRKSHRLYKPDSDLNKHFKIQYTNLHWFNKIMTNLNSYIKILANLGKHLSICPHLYVGIAQIAITPTPRTQTGTLGHFFSGAILPFLPFFTLFTIFYHFFSE